MIPREQSNVPAVMNTFTLIPRELPIEPEVGESRLPITHYGWVLWKRRWWILLFATISTLVTLFVSLRITPVYEATATLDFDRRVPSGVIGRESEVTVQDAEQFITAQIRLLQSDSVLRPVAQRFNLIDITRKPSGINGVTVQEEPVRLSNLKVTRVPGATAVWRGD